MIKSDNIKSRVGLLKLRKKRRRKVKVQKMLQNERNNSTKKCTIKYCFITAIHPVSFITIFHYLNLVKQATFQYFKIFYFFILALFIYIIHIRFNNIIVYYAT